MESHKGTEEEEEEEERKIWWGAETREGAETEEKNIFFKRVNLQTAVTLNVP